LLLEREIVNKCGEDWSNQMPAASGLVGPSTDKRAAVDLVHREGPTKYSLIELKVDSNNPLFAAIEILQYGLLFVWSRNNLEKLGYDLHPQPVLAANEITLSVLAPGDYYSDYSLSNLTDALNNAFPDFKLRGDLILAFEFNRLGSELEIFPIESG
jgi:hypothetical protein